LDRTYFHLALLATGLAFIVVILGAFTRLSDAGLGCPDWPGCYGQITVPQTQMALHEAAKAYPNLTVEKNKAWPEMIHRYFAGSLGLIILALAVWALLRKRKYTAQPIAIPLCLLALVIFQAALGMWTVTWKLLPLVVMGHLLGGMTIFGMLWWLYLSGNPPTEKIPTYSQQFLNKLFVASFIGLIIIGIQIFLGGWTSSNYAAIICLDFPYCHGQLFPQMDIIHGFNFFSPIGANYQGGALEAPARVAIQMFHRYGGAITGLYIGMLAWYLIFFRSTAYFHFLGWLIFILLITQICLGMLNVLWHLPLAIAVAHNGTAALLLLSLITLVFKINSIKNH
jgi:cytochrome c oxidase assembly protein subunit 15